MEEERVHGTNACAEIILVGGTRAEKKCAHPPCTVSLQREKNSALRTPQRPQGGKMLAAAIIQAVESPSKSYGSGPQRGASATARGRETFTVLTGSVLRSAS